MLPLHRVLSLVVPFLPKSVRFELWAYLCTRGRQVWGGSGSAQRIEGHMYVKSNRVLRLTEGAVTEFVRKHTTMPVPFVIDNFTTADGTTTLVLSELPGDTLQATRDEYGITKEQSQRVSRQISTLLAQLRAISSPSAAVSGFNDTQIFCERIMLGSTPWGPWPSVADFHTFLLRSNVQVPPDMYDEVWDKIKTIHGRSYRVCLTHNDFAPQNILVDKDYNVTGILDWEASAWLPEYWEAAKSVFLPWYRKGWWYDIMSDVFPEYETERRAEFYIWRYREYY